MLHFRLLAFFFLLCGLVVESAARRRLGGGYLEPIDTDDPDIVSAAKFAADKLKGTVVEVTSAHEQIVAGWMYHITMHMKSQQQKDEKCMIKVWVRHWLNQMKLVRATCTPMHS